MPPADLPAPLARACLSLKNANPIAWNDFLRALQASYKQSLENLAAADASNVMVYQGHARCMKALLTDFEDINRLK